jgi:hypothetical protein
MYGILLESWFVLVTFKNVLFKYGYRELFSVKIWSLWHLFFSKQSFERFTLDYFWQKKCEISAQRKRTLALKLEFSDFFPTAPNL